MRWPTEHADKQAVIIAATFWGRGATAGSVRGRGQVEEAVKNNEERLKHADSMC